MAAICKSEDMLTFPYGFMHSRNFQIKLMTHDYVFYIKQLQDYWSHKIMTIEYFAGPFNTSVTPPDATTGFPVDEHPCIKKQWPTSHDLDGQICAGSAPILDIKAIDFNIVHIVVIRVFETINLSSVNCSSKPSPLFFIHRYRRSETTELPSQISTGGWLWSRPIFG